MCIYLETTIPSYLAARPAKVLLQAAKQKATQLWWNHRSAADELVSSYVTLDEASLGEPEMAKARRDYLHEVRLLPVTAETGEFIVHLLASGLVPPEADADAAHIALATVHQCDILLTWNCRHIANAAIQRRLRELAEAHRHVLPTICTPNELLPRIN